MRSCMDKFLLEVEKCVQMGDVIQLPLDSRMDGPGGWRIKCALLTFLCYLSHSL